MAYPTGTVLERSEALPEITELITTDDGQVENTFPNPLNVVRVIAPSPVKVASREEWQGVSGDQIIVAPVEQFGANEVIPEGILNRDYEVRTFGDEEEPQKIHLDPRRERLLQGESPEQAFARAAREAAKGESKVEKSTRGRTPIKAE